MILALGSRPIPASQFSYTSVLVGMSRARARVGVRLLKPAMEGLGFSSFDYITDLRPSLFVDAFFQGYNGDGEDWDPERVIEFVRMHKDSFRR